MRAYVASPFQSRSTSISPPSASAEEEKETSADGAVPGETEPDAEEEEKNPDENNTDSAGPDAGQAPEKDPDSELTIGASNGENSPALPEDDASAHWLQQYQQAALAASGMTMLRSRSVRASSASPSYSMITWSGGQLEFAPACGAAAKLDGQQGTDPQLGLHADEVAAFPLGLRIAQVRHPVADPLARLALAQHALLRMEQRRQILHGHQLGHRIQIALDGLHIVGVPRRAHIAAAQNLHQRKLI